MTVPNAGTTVRTRMILVGRQPADLDGPECDKIGKEVAEGVSRVGNERGRVAGHADGKLATREEQIQDAAVGMKV